MADLFDPLRNNKFERNIYNLPSPASWWRWNNTDMDETAWKAIPQDAAGVFNFSGPGNPSITVVSPIANVNVILPATFSGTANAPAGFRASAPVQIRFDTETAWRNCSGTTNWTYSLTALAVGNHTAEVQVTDINGTTAVATRPFAIQGVGTCPTGSVIVQSGDNLATIINGTASGKTICIADGTYNVGATALKPASGVTIMAQNEPTLTPTSKNGVNSVRPKVHITGTALNTDGALFVPAGAVTFHGLEISGPQGNTPPDEGRGIKASQSGKCTVEYCYIHNCANQGVGRGDLVIRYNEFTDCGSLPFASSGTTGSAIKTTFKLTAHHNYIWECWGTALWLDCNGQEMICYDNLMEWMQRYGIHYEISNVTNIANSKSYNNVIKGSGKHKAGGNWIEVAGHQGSGIGVISSRNHEVYGNTVTNCINAGIIVAHRNIPRNTNPPFGKCGEGWEFQGVLVHDNVATGNGTNYDGLSQAGVTASNNT